MHRRVLVLYRDAPDVEPYRDALLAAATEPVLTRVDDLPSLGGFDGLLLTGGPDVDPSLYHAARHPETEESDRERDAVETNVLNEALRLDLPVLAICRGLQLMNVAHGGDLIQHVDTVDRHRVEDTERASPAHDILIEPGSLLHSIAGTRRWQVNSRHHQAVKTLGTGLRVSALDPEDGTIEALERPDKWFVLAVQWHPENQALVDAGQLRIFERFREAMRR